MRIRSRATIVVTIILVLSMMNVSGLIGSQMGLGVAQGLPSEQYPVTISLGTEERVFFANHKSGLADGNWIELKGGTTVKLPSMSFVYEGEDIVYPIGDITVKIDSEFILPVNYPLSNHRVYEVGDPVSATFWGSTDLKDETVSFILLRLSSLSELRDVLTEGLGGNIFSLLNSLEAFKSVSLNPAGDGTYIFNNLDAGDYLLAVVKIELPKFYVYSATIIEVVDHTLTVTAPSSVEQDDIVKVDLALDAPQGSYIYGVAMIRELAYSGTIKLSTDGTVTGTKLYLNGKQMTEGDFFIDFFFGTNTQSDLNIDLIEDLLTTALNPNELVFDHTTATNTGSISLPTSLLTPGNYILFAGAWKDFESRLIGFKQTTITIEAPYEPPTPPKNKKPMAAAGPNVKIPVNGTIYFSGAGSYDRDGHIFSYSWDFGDGTKDFGEIVPHTYSKPGHYTVTLTVKDNRGAEDSDKCEVFVWQPPAPVADKFGQLVPGEQKGFKVNALNEASTIVTLDTTNQVTVTILSYEGNPHPGDPISGITLPIYVDVEVSDPDAVIWPIYVEMFYTDEDVEGIEEFTLAIYYWFNGTWQRCSNTGVDTENNIVWAYMTADEAAGSPILIAGMHAITPPPLPPFLDSLVITPEEIELGDNVTISFVIRNSDSQHITYGVDIHIEDVSDPPSTWPPPPGLWLRIWVDLEAYELKMVSHTITPDTCGVFNVTVAGMTGSFKVGTWPPEPPPLPAEFVVSGLTITREPLDPRTWTYEIAANVTNVGEQEGTYTVAFKLDGLEVDWRTVELEGGETTIIVYSVVSGVGSWPIEVDGLTGSIDVETIPGPKFEFSNLRIFYPGVIPPEVERDETVTVTVSVEAENVGELMGSQTVELKVDGYVEDSQETTLEGGASITILFELTRGEGTYQVEVEGMTDGFTVVAAEIPFWMRPGTIAGIMIVIIAAVTILYAYWKGILPSLYPEIDAEN